MSVTELKAQIIAMVSDEKDERILRDVVSKLTPQPIAPAAEPTIEFTHDEQLEISAAIAEDDAGETLKHAEVMANAWQLIADFEKKKSDARA